MPTNLPRAHSQHKTNKQTKWCQALFYFWQPIPWQMICTSRAQYGTVGVSEMIWPAHCCCNWLTFTCLPEQEWLSERKRLLRVCFQNWLHLRTPIRLTWHDYMFFIRPILHCLSENETHFSLVRKQQDLWLNRQAEKNTTSKANKHPSCQSILC